MLPHKRHQKPKSLEGLFMWLPPYHRIQNKEYPTKYSSGGQLQRAAYGHPVVVLSSKEESDGTVAVLLMTSFGGKTLQEHASQKDRAACRDKLALEHIPIDPSPSHGPHYLTLQACGASGRLAKDSYITTHPLVRVKFTVLLEYGDVVGGTWAKRLDTRSCHQLQKYIQFIEPVPKAAVGTAEAKAAARQQGFEARVEEGSSSNLLPTYPHQAEARPVRSGNLYNGSPLVSAAASRAPLNPGRHHHYGSISLPRSGLDHTASRPGWDVDIPSLPTAPLAITRGGPTSIKISRYPASPLLPSHHIASSQRDLDGGIICLSVIFSVFLVVSVILLVGWVVVIAS